MNSRSTEIKSVAGTALRGGIVSNFSPPQLRFEVDGANAARDFLRSYGIPQAAVEIVWDVIALHTTPGIPKHKKPEVALVTSGVEMDVLGIAYDRFTDTQREAVVAAHPRGDGFMNNVMLALNSPRAAERACASIARRPLALPLSLRV